MIAHLINRLRTEKNLSKNKLGRMCSMDLSYITHLEKGDRYPSIEACKKICDNLDVPYVSLLGSYGKKLDLEQRDRQMEKFICCDKILALNSIDGLIDCPTGALSASFAVKMNDKSMEPKIKKDDYAFIELNVPLKSKDIGLFQYNGTYLIRKLSFGKRVITLKALSSKDLDIKIKKDDSFFMLGKVVGINSLNK